MKKSKIFVFNGKKALVNCLIVLMLTAISLVAVYGVNFVQSSTIINGVYYRGDEKANKVTLMINVYWGTEYIDDMLETLKAHDVKTTFFVGGTWAVKESETLKKIYDAGHEIGNHGYYHENQATISAKKNYEEILNTHNLVKQILGIEMNLFAPPSGSYSKKTVEIASELGYKTVMWSDGRDTVDWRYKNNPQEVLKRALKNLKSGDFILMHPTQATRDVLDEIITQIQAKGFTLTTVSDNIGSA